MDTKAKRTITSLKGDNLLSKLLKKINLDNSLSNDEWSYILSSALILIDEYDKTINDGYFQFAYYLILLYSLTTKDWMPLYHFSVNAGFYPLSDYLYDKINNQKKLEDEIIYELVNVYRVENMTLMKDQKLLVDELCKSQSNFRAFIAPTSFGKSSFIKKDIELFKDKKIGIIVPSKALIWQTFNYIKEVARKHRLRVIVHDAEYNNENGFIGIFTQERAIRLIQDSKVYFDILYIDEAHNIFDFNDRQILLTRLIRLNNIGNENQKVVFLSPLVKDVKNLSIRGISNLIDEKRINKNLKDYNIHYLSNHCESFAYNRFLDELWATGKSYDNIFEYISNKEKNKNLVYFRRPIEIEKFAKDLIERTDLIHDENLDKIAQLLRSYSDPEYLLARAVERGFIYIHAKIPEFIKDYLYECFIKTKNIKYLISNSCVLEGVNFPIESIFILNSYGLDGNKLINLCGRVNRLNDIFNNLNDNIERLLCDIHFIESDYNSGKMINKVSLLRADIKDNVENPIMEKAIVKKEKKERAEKIIKTEDDFIKAQNFSDCKYVLIKNGIDKKYKDFDNTFELIKEKLGKLKPISDVENTMRTLKECFILGLSFSKDSNALERLQNEETVNYYINYLLYAYHSSLKSKITYIYKNFEYILENSVSKLTYVGKSFGTVKWRESDIYAAYVDLKTLNKSQLINLAIIKSKTEDDFIDFELIPFVKTLFDIGTISEDVYNKFAYGTNDEAIISLYKAGFSSGLISFITDNNLLQEIENQGYGFKASKRFQEELEKQDDLVKFEIKKYLI